MKFFSEVISRLFELLPDSLLYLVFGFFTTTVFIKSMYSFCSDTFSLSFLFAKDPDNYKTYKKELKAFLSVYESEHPDFSIGISKLASEDLDYFKYHFSSNPFIVFLFKRCYKQLVNYYCCNLMFLCKGYDFELNPFDFKLMDPSDLLVTKFFDSIFDSLEVKYNNEKV